MAARIKAARELGDLKENAEYHIAKDDQAHLETKIKRLTERLRAARVVEGTRDPDVVGFGSTVGVVDEASGRALSSRSSGRPRPTSRPAACRRSRPSPARSSAPAPVTTVSVETPGGERRYRVRQRQLSSDFTERVLVARPDQGRRAGAVGRRRRKRSRPRDEHRGLAAVLGAREVGRRRGLVGDGDDRRVEHRGPPRRARPRQSSTGRRPAIPIATSHWPTRHARPNESAITTAGRDAGQLAQPRAQRARRGVGVQRQQHEARRRRWTRRRRRSRRRSRGACGRSSTPGRERTIASVSPRMTSTRRGSLPCSAASASARSPGSTLAGATTRPSAFETTLCATTRTSPSANRPRRRRAAARGRRRAAPRACPGVPRRRSRVRSRSAAARARRRSLARVGDAAEHPARVRRAAAAVGERDAQVGEVGGRVDVERERLDRLDRARHAGCGRGLLVQRAAVGPERGLDDVRRGQQQRVRAAARGGRARSRPSARRPGGRAAPRARPGRRRACRRGRAARASRPPRSRARCRSASRRSGPPRCRRAGRWRRSRGRSPRPRGSEVTSRTSVTAAVRRSAISTSVTIASASARRVPPDSSSPRRALAAPKRLTGSTANVVTGFSDERAIRRGPRRTAASRRRRGGGRPRRS